MTFEELQKKSYEITKSKGFNLNDDILQILLIATEIEEALQNYSNIKLSSRKFRTIYNSFVKKMQELEEERKTTGLSSSFYLKNENNLGEELADFIIRVFSFAENKGINIKEEIEAKLKVNKERPYLHNKSC